MSRSSDRQHAALGRAEPSTDDVDGADEVIDPGSTSTALITGAAGFIGAHLACALLERGWRVVGIDNFDPFYTRRAKLANLDRIRAAKPGQSAAPARVAPPQTSDADFTFLEADIRDRARMEEIFQREKPHSLFHIAALAGVRPSIEDPARYASVNLDGTVSVLDAARASGCRNVIFASSSSVYGNNRKVPFAEDDPVDEPISPYAATKRAGELICHSYAHLFDLRIAALRFFTVYGPAQRPDLAISKFMRLIAAGEEVPMFGDGTSSRDYTYIGDIIAGVLAAHDRLPARIENVQIRHGGPAEGMASKRPNVQRKPTSDSPHPLAPGSAGGPSGGGFRVYNLGNSHPVTLAEMIDTIARIVGKPARIKRLPMQPGDVERTWADLSRSSAELAYHPTTSFEAGVSKQWEWLRAKFPLP